MPDDGGFCMLAFLVSGTLAHQRPQTTSAFCRKFSTQVSIDGDIASLFEDKYVSNMRQQLYKEKTLEAPHFEILPLVFDRIFLV